MFFCHGKKKLRFRAGSVKLALKLMMKNFVFAFALLCALTVAFGADGDPQGPMSQWMEYHGSADGTSVTVTVDDIQQPVPGQALIVQSSADHLHDLVLTGVSEENANATIGTTTVTRSKDGRSYATVVVQLCDIANHGELKVDLTCVNEATKSTFEVCPDPVAFNYTVAVLYYNANWGELPASGENLYMAFPYSSNAGDEHELTFSFTAPKDVSKYASIAVSAAPVFQFDQQEILTSAGDDVTLLSVSTKINDECPADGSGDVAKVSGTESMSVTTASFSSKVKSGQEYHVFFEGPVKATLYVITVSLLPAASTSSGSGGGGTSAGWVTVIAFVCFGVGVAIPLTVAVVLYVLKKRSYDAI